jgi:signal transduction histidine kinase
VHVEDRTVPAQRAVPVGSQAISFVVALAFAAACLFAFAGRAASEPARTFFWGSFGYGLAVATGGVHLHPGSDLPALLRIGSIVLTPLLLVRIAFVFPRPAHWRSVHAIAGFLLAGGALVAGMYAASFLAYAHGVGTWERLRAFERIADAWIVLVTVTGATLVWRNSRSAELARERRQAKWVAWGVGVGVLPFVLFHVLPLAFGAPALLSLDVARLCALAVPSAFAIAVIRHQFMDIDVIIRRSLIYAALAAMLTAIYVAIGLFLGERLGRPGEPSVETAKLAAAGIAVALFFPTRKAIGDAVDHTFFRIRTSHERAAREFREAITGVRDPDEWARVLSAFLHHALGLTRAVAVHGPRAAWAPAPIADAEAVVRELAALSDRAPVTCAAPGRTGLPELEHADFPRALLERGLVVYRPLRGTSGPLGAVALGEKEIERRFIEQELALLDAIALEASAALERILLVRHAADEESRLKRQEEIDRRKSEFLSQVAHDLGTPLTSILWSSQNLVDGAAPDPGQAAQSIHAAASHLHRLVANLSTLARLDDGAPAPRIEPVRLDRALAEACVALAPLARERGVALEFADCAAAAAWPKVRVGREGLMKVAINLVDNALKHAPKGTTVRVGLARPAPFLQAFTVEDHGPGVPDAFKQAIFERYARGPGEDGGRAGFGLGLYVARTQLDGSGGTLEVRDTPGGGATFVCTLREEGGPWPAS